MAMNEKSRKRLPVRRFIAWFLVSAALFGLLASLGGGSLSLLQKVVAVLGVALVIACSAVVLGTLMDKVPRS